MACQGPREPESAPTEHATAPTAAPAASAPAEPATPDSPEAETTIAEAPAAPRPEAPSVVRRDERIVVTSPWLVEGLALIPDGLAFAQGGEIWTLQRADLSLKQRAKVTDPHGLVSDGTSLYWLGDADNGRMALATGKVEFLPPFGTRGQQDDLAVGDALYGRNARGHVMRLEGMHLARVDIRTERAWSVMSGLEAGKRVVYLPILERGRGRPSFFLLRIPTGGGKPQRIEMGGPPRRTSWSVAANGSLVFLRGRSTVMQQGVKAKAAKQRFEEPGLIALCWCGSAVYTFDGDERVLRRHAKGTTTGEVVVSDIEMPEWLACDAERVVWSTPERDHPSEIHMVSLP